MLHSPSQFAAYYVACDFNEVCCLMHIIDRRISVPPEGLTDDFPEMSLTERQCPPVSARRVSTLGHVMSHQTFIPCRLRTFV